MDVLNRRIELPDDFDPNGDPELARRICAAFLSYQQDVSVATAYKKVPDNVGDLWRLCAALVTFLWRQSVDHRLSLKDPSEAPYVYPSEKPQ